MLPRQVVRQSKREPSEERMAEIESDFQQRLAREKAKRVPNPLRVDICEPLDIDDLYLQEEGGGACLVCHK